MSVQHINSRNPSPTERATLLAEKPPQQLAQTLRNEIPEPIKPSKTYSRTKISHPSVPQSGKKQVVIKAENVPTLLQHATLQGDEEVKKKSCDDLYDF